MYRLLVLGLLAGCTPTTFAFSPTVKSFHSKPKGCHVEALTSLPDRDYEEIGTLELYNGPEPKTLDAFKAAVADQVCSVGGDAAIGIADMKGIYSKGTIIAYTK